MDEFFEEICVNFQVTPGHHLGKTSFLTPGLPIRTSPLVSLVNSQLRRRWLIEEQRIAVLKELSTLPGRAGRGPCSRAALLKLQQK